MNICGCVMIEKEENIFVRQNFHAEDTEILTPSQGNGIIGNLVVWGRWNLEYFLMS